MKLVHAVVVIFIYALAMIGAFWLIWLSAGCSVLQPTVDLNGDGYINAADSPAARAVASAVPGGSGMLDLVGYGLGALGVGGAAVQTVRKRRAAKDRERIRAIVNRAILADPDTDDILYDELNGDLEPQAREKIRNKRRERDTRIVGRESSR